MKKGTITFKSSIQKLNHGFEWAKKQALDYAHDGCAHDGAAGHDDRQGCERNEKNGTGKWYEAALPGRNAFCMRDVSHQAEGASALGLCEHTKNMLYLFAKSIAKERDYCGFWEITGEGLPCPDDYDNDQDFWYNLPGSFEVIMACYEQYLWTGDEDYLRDPVFTKYYRQTCEELVRQWDADGDGILEHYPEQGRRGIATYNEKDIQIKAGADMLASQYAAYGAAARMLELAGEDASLVESYREKQSLLKEQYLKKWYIGQGRGFYGAMLQDGSFFQEYDEEGNFLPIRFGILDGEPQMREAIEEIKKHEPPIVEVRSYYPQIFFRCGERGYGMDYLLSLCNPALERREYPEVSYALVGTVVNWVMGIRRGESGAVVTCASLPEGEWAGVEQLPIGKGMIDVLHRGRKETTLTNRGQKPILWRAAFLGEYESLICQGEKIACERGQNEAGEVITSGLIQVEAGESRKVSVR